MRKLIAGAVLALSVTGVGGTAFAGEVTGSGKGGPEGNGVTGAKANASSACAFSGLEDGEEGGPAGPGEIPQNWGQISPEDRAFLASVGAHPGDACRGNAQQEG